jgi:hypothetical protein
VKLHDRVLSVGNRECGECLRFDWLFRQCVSLSLSLSSFFYLILL